MTTIKEIAQRAGVSIGTVDRVLHNRGMVSEQTKRRIEAIVRELDYQPNRAAQGLAVRKKKLKLLFVLPDPTGHPFYRDILTAAEKKAEDLKQYGVQVIFLIVDLNALLTKNSAEELLREKEAEDFDGLATHGIPAPLIRSLLAKAESRQCPVVFYNDIFPDSDYLAYVGCDYVQAGRLAAGLCAIAGGERSTVCLFSEVPKDISFDQPDVIQVGSHKGRLAGFRQEIQDHYPQIKLTDVLKTGTTPAENDEAVARMLEEYPDVNIVYVLNPGDYGICEAIARADKDHRIRIITNDLVPGQREMIRKGIISATIVQEPEKQGALPLDLLFHYLAYGIVPKEKLCYTSLSIQIAQNL